VMMMPAVALAGMPVNLIVVKLGMAAYGALGIVLAYRYGSRISRSTAVRLGMPLLLAFDPYYWLFSRMVLTEVPTVLWALVALLLAEIGWAEGDIRPARALGFGLVAGLGMLIRGSLFGALFLPLVYLLVLRPERIDRWRLVSYCSYAAGFLVPFAAWKLRCSFIPRTGLGQDGIDQLAMLLRAHPVDPSSPLRSLAEIGLDMRASLATAIHVLPRSIVPGLWTSEPWNWLGAAGAPVAAALTLILLTISCAARRNLPLILLYGSMAALDLFYAAGGMARLWVPVAALVALSLPPGLERLSLLARRGGQRVAIAAGAALAASLALFIAEHDAQPYRDPTYAALAELFQSLRGSAPLEGNVLTPNPEAFALVTGMHAPMPRRAIGVDPDYSYVILPSDEWTERLGGTLIADCPLW
jgi:hypothetical protein